LWLATQAFAAALAAPGQFLAIATNRKLRRNHALEHATINVMEQRHGPQRLAGMASEEGFTIRGYADAEVLREAAQEGLARLKRGEHWLAVHDRCGTSRAVGNLVSAVILLVVLFGLGRFSLVNVILVMLVANLVGPSLGRLLQVYVTTSTDVDDLYIVDFRCGVVRSGWELLLANPALAGVPVICQVRTASLVTYESWPGP